MWRNEVSLRCTNSIIYLIPTPLLEKRGGGEVKEKAGRNKTIMCKYQP